MPHFRSPYVCNRLAAFSVSLAGLLPLVAHAVPWLAPGDRTLRSDVEILAARHLIDGLITTWPLPKGQIEKLADDDQLGDEPLYVQLAAQRVLHALGEDCPLPAVRLTADLRATSSAAIVRDFGNSARDDFDARAGMLFNGEDVDAALHVGDQSRFNQSDTKLSFDGTYATARVGNWRLYSGWIDKWYGPGWTSSLILSNNARPLPKIGLTRDRPEAPQNFLLRWMGPWQLDAFVGLLDGPRTDEDTLFGSLRLTFMPVRDLEIGLTRTTEFCGSGHDCKPLKSVFQVNNGSTNPNSTNDEAAMDLKYTLNLGALQISPYGQIMNEDNGPFVHAYTSYLGGSTFSGPLGTGGAHWRTTVEYGDTVPSLNTFDLGKKIYGAAYNNSQYVDGDRYRGRALGFSLDSDSRLLTFSDAFVDARGRSLRMTYYRAEINSAPLAAAMAGTPLPGATVYGTTTSFNAVSARPAAINIGEVTGAVPWHEWSFQVTARAQDAQPYPRSGGKISGELDVRYQF